MNNQRRHPQRGTEGIVTALEWGKSEKKDNNRVNRKARRIIKRMIPKIVNEY